MTLKYKVTSLNEVPAEFHSLYLERELPDDTGINKKVFILDAEGVVEKSKLEEFRGSNISLKKRVSESEQQCAQLTDRLSPLQIDHGVVQAATKRGLRAAAIPDITSRARQVFKLVGG